jgi:hypothetical protein
MANLTPKNLYIGNDDASNVYTVSSNVGSYAIIKTVNICNTGNGAILCNIHIIPSGGAAGSNNKLLSNLTVAVSETVSYDSSIVLNSGSSIYVDASIATATYTISGVEYTT